MPDPTPDRIETDPPARDRGYLGWMVIVWLILWTVISAPVYNFLRHW